MTQAQFVETLDMATAAGPLAFKGGAQRFNVLLVGAHTAVEAALSALVSDVPGAVSVWTVEAPMPARDGLEVVIVRDVDRLSPTLQDAWVSWMEGGHRRPQIIATSRVPVFPLVAEGVFRSELYYRLNTLLLDLAADQTA